MAERILPHCIPERAADQHFHYDADHGHGDEISMAAIPIAAEARENSLTLGAQKLAPLL